MVRFVNVVLTLLMAFLVLPERALGQEEHFVDVGTHTLHAVVSGSGAPVVVLETGLGLDMDTWAPVVDRIAEFTTVIAYSRAGYGESEPSPAPRTPVHITDELVGLLDGLEVTGPVVLAGHSLGGLYARVFAARFPSRMSGLVLIDSSHERQYYDQAVVSPTFWEEMEAGLSEIAESGDGGSSGEARVAWQIFRRGTLPEAYPLPDVPTVVLTAQRLEPRYTTGSPEAMAIRQRIQEEFLDHATWSRQVLVPESFHNIHEDAPTLVVEMIRSVVERSR
ncbi:MAG: alpha/beta hydrolase [Gemmatimonadota bacterium]